MSRKLKTQLGRFQLAAFAEGSSLLALIFIAVPLKRVFGIPELSSALGPLHGLLFMVYVFQTIQIKIEKRWSHKNVFVLLMAAFIPFGTFYFVPKIIREEQA